MIQGNMGGGGGSNMVLMQNNFVIQYFSFLCWTRNLFCAAQGPVVLGSFLVMLFTVVLPLSPPAWQPNASPKHVACIV